MSYDKPSATTNFTGYDPLNLSFGQTEAEVQVGAAQSFAAGWAKPFTIPEALPAANRIVLNGTEVTGKNGTYFVSLSLSGGGTVQLTASLTDAKGNVTPNPVGTFSYTARSRQVQVTSGGLVSCLSRSNGASVIVSYPTAQVNAGFDNARPDGKNNLTAELVVTILS
jgi:hypothetical protein